MGRGAEGGVYDRDSEEVRHLKGTIAFAAVGRSQYSFDVYSLPVEDFPPGASGLDPKKLKEQRLTDGASVNHNGYLVEGNAKNDILKWIRKSGEPADDDSDLLDSADELNVLAHVNERDGCLRLAVSLSFDEQADVKTPDSLFKKWGGISSNSKGEQQLEQEKDDNVYTVKSLLVDDGIGPSSTHAQDRPQVGGGRIVFVSTVQAQKDLRQSWTAVYSSPILRSSSSSKKSAVRLTPEGVSDYSPALSPSGKWVMAASLQGKGWQGEITHLNTDLYVFDAADGSRRRLVVKNAGWPSWGADESTIYFHRFGADGWWSVFSVSLPEGFLESEEEFGENGLSDRESRVTPPGLHAFTPSASGTGKWIAVATRRHGSKYRHVEIFDLRSRSFIKLTEGVSPDVHHFNPFVTRSSNKVLYHRCRGTEPIRGEVPITHRLESIKSPIPGLALLRVDGSFPVFSPDGSHVAYCAGTIFFGEVFVTKSNGEGKRKIFSGTAWGLAWDPKRKGVVYITTGRAFDHERGQVHILSVSDVDAGTLSGNEVSSLGEPDYKVLTKRGTGNNGFPHPSPDGKHLVFRSGRSGHMNLYIMDAVNGEEGGIRQLTNGPWTDTMPNWSPKGDLIAFSSNRDESDKENYSGFLIRPDGSGLRKILSDGGRVNHLCFSPDGQSLVFTADFAGVSAEPISTPNQFQPYGELFVSNIDGSGIRRLTHNCYEDGTPDWSNVFRGPADMHPKGGDPVNGLFVDQMWLADEGEAPKDTVEDKAPVAGCPVMSHEKKPVH